MWPRDIRPALEYHNERPRLKGEIGVWHNKAFYWVFVIDARHSIVIYRAFIPHPRHWLKYKLNEPRWMYVRSITIPYRDSHEWANGVRALEATSTDTDHLARVIRYRETNIGFAVQRGAYHIGAAHYQGMGTEFRMSRRRFYWSFESREVGFSILNGLLRQQQIDGGLLYMKDGDDIVEVNDWYEEDSDIDSSPVDKN